MSKAVRTRFWLTIARDVGCEVEEVAARMPDDIADAVLDRAAERLLREMSAVDCQPDEIRAALDVLARARTGLLADPA